MFFNLNVIEYYPSSPIKGFDDCFSDFRGCEIFEVPVLRVFGSTSSGRKGCVHVHGVFPYFSVRWKDVFPDIEVSESRRYIQELAWEIDKALNVSARKSSSSHHHVFNVVPFKGVHFYGYHAKKDDFIRIYFYKPYDVAKTAEIMTNGGILNKIIQPFEAHIPYILQFMIDHNISRTLEISHFKLRASHDSNDNISNTTIKSLYHASNDGNNLSESPLESGIDAATYCGLELDCRKTDLLNIQKKTSLVHSNPGIAAIWKEELMRRRLHNPEAEITQADSQVMRNEVLSEKEIQFVKILRQKIFDAPTGSFQNQKVPSEDRTDGSAELPGSQLSSSFDLMLGFLQDMHEHCDDIMGSTEERKTFCDVSDMSNEMSFFGPNAHGQCENDSILGPKIGELSGEDEDDDYTTTEMTQRFMPDLPSSSETVLNLGLTTDSDKIMQLDGVFEDDLEELDRPLLSIEDSQTYPENSNDFTGPPVLEPVQPLSQEASAYIKKYSLKSCSVKVENHSFLKHWNPRKPIPLSMLVEMGIVPPSKCMKTKSTQHQTKQKKFKSSNKVKRKSCLKRRKDTKLKDKNLFTFEHDGALFCDKAKKPLKSGHLSNKLAEQVNKIHENSLIKNFKNYPRLQKPKLIDSTKLSSCDTKAANKSLKKKPSDSSSKSMKDLNPPEPLLLEYRKSVSCSSSNSSKYLHQSTVSEFKTVLPSISSSSGISSNNSVLTKNDDKATKHSKNLKRKFKSSKKFKKKDCNHAKKNFLIKSTKAGNKRPKKFGYKDCQYSHLSGKSVNGNEIVILDSIKCKDQSKQLFENKETTSKQISKSTQSNKIGSYQGEKSTALRENCISSASPQSQNGINFKKLESLTGVNLSKLGKEVVLVKKLTQEEIDHFCSKQNSSVITKKVIGSELFSENCIPISLECFQKILNYNKRGKHLFPTQNICKKPKVSSKFRYRRKSREEISSSSIEDFNNTESFRTSFQVRRNASWNHVYQFIRAKLLQKSMLSNAMESYIQNDKLSLSHADIYDVATISRRVVCSTNCNSVYHNELEMSELSSEVYSSDSKMIPTKPMKSNSVLLADEVKHFGSAWCDSDLITLSSKSNSLRPAEEVKDSEMSAKLSCDSKVTTDSTKCISLRDEFGVSSKVSLCGSKLTSDSSGCQVLDLNNKLRLLQLSSKLSLFESKIISKELTTCEELRKISIFCEKLFSSNIPSPEEMSLGGKLNCVTLERSLNSLRSFTFGGKTIVINDANLSTVMKTIMSLSSFSRLTDCNWVITQYCPHIDRSAKKNSSEESENTGNSDANNTLTPTVTDGETGENPSVECTDSIPVDQNTTPEKNQEQPHYYTNMNSNSEADQSHSNYHSNNSMLILGPTCSSTGGPSLTAVNVLASAPIINSKLPSELSSSNCFKPFQNPLPFAVKSKPFTSKSNYPNLDKKYDPLQNVFARKSKPFISPVASTSRTVQDNLPMAVKGRKLSNNSSQTVIKSVSKTADLDQNAPGQESTLNLPAISAIQNTSINVNDIVKLSDDFNPRVVLSSDFQHLGLMSGDTCRIDPNLGVLKNSEESASSNTISGKVSKVDSRQKKESCSIPIIPGSSKSNNRKNDEEKQHSCDHQKVNSNEKKDSKSKDPVLSNFSGIGTTIVGHDLYDVVKRKAAIKNSNKINTTSIMPKSSKPKPSSGTNKASTDKSISNKHKPVKSESSSSIKFGTTEKTDKKGNKGLDANAPSSSNQTHKKNSKRIDSNTPSNQTDKASRKGLESKVVPATNQNVKKNNKKRYLNAPCSSKQNDIKISKELDDNAEFTTNQSNKKHKKHDSKVPTTNQKDSKGLNFNSACSSNKTDKKSGRELDSNAARSFNKADKKSGKELESNTASYINLSDEEHNKRLDFRGKSSSNQNEKKNSEGLDSSASSTFNQAEQSREELESNAASTISQTEKKKHVELDFNALPTSNKAKKKSRKEPESNAASTTNQIEKKNHEGLDSNALSAFNQTEQKSRKELESNAASTTNPIEKKKQEELDSNVLSTSKKAKKKARKELESNATSTTKEIERKKHEGLDSNALSTSNKTEQKSRKKLESNAAFTISETEKKKHEKLDSNALSTSPKAKKKSRKELESNAASTTNPIEKKNKEELDSNALSTQNQAIKKSRKQPESIAASTTNQTEKEKHVEMGSNVAPSTNLSDKKPSEGLDSTITSSNLTEKRSSGENTNPSPKSSPADIKSLTRLDSSAASKSDQTETVNCKRQESHTAPTFNLGDSKSHKELNTAAPTSDNTVNNSNNLPYSIQVGTSKSDSVKSFKKQFSDLSIPHSSATSSASKSIKDLKVESGGKDGVELGKQTTRKKRKTDSSKQKHKTQKVLSSKLSLKLCKRETFTNEKGNNDSPISQTAWKIDNHLKDDQYNSNPTSGYQPCGSRYSSRRISQSSLGYVSIKSEPPDDYEDQSNTEIKDRLSAFDFDASKCADNLNYSPYLSGGRKIRHAPCKDDDTNDFKHVKKGKKHSKEKRESKQLKLLKVSPEKKPGTISTLFSDFKETKAKFTFKGKETNIIDSVDSDEEDLQKCERTSRLSRKCKEKIKISPIPEKKSLAPITIKFNKETNCFVSNSSQSSSPTKPTCKPDYLNLPSGSGSPKITQETAQDNSDEKPELKMKLKLKTVMTKNNEPQIIVVGKKFEVEDDDSDIQEIPWIPDKEPDKKKKKESKRRHRHHRSEVDLYPEGHFPVDVSKIKKEAVDDGYDHKLFVAPIKLSLTPKQMPSIAQEKKLEPLKLCRSSNSFYVEQSSSKRKMEDTNVSPVKRKRGRPAKVVKHASPQKNVAPFQNVTSFNPGPISISTISKKSPEKCSIEFNTASFKSAENGSGNSQVSAHLPNVIIKQEPVSDEDDQQNSVTNTLEENPAKMTRRRRSSLKVDSYKKYFDSDSGNSADEHLGAGLKGRRKKKRTSYDESDNLEYNPTGCRPKRKDTKRISSENDVEVVFENFPSETNKEYQSCRRKKSTNLDDSENQKCTPCTVNVERLSISEVEKHVLASLKSLEGEQQVSDKPVASTGSQPIIFDPTMSVNPTVDLMPIDPLSTPLGRSLSTSTSESISKDFIHGMNSSMLSQQYNSSKFASDTDFYSLNNPTSNFLDPFNQRFLSDKEPDSSSPFKTGSNLALFKKNTLYSVDPISEYKRENSMKELNPQRNLPLEVERPVFEMPHCSMKENALKSDPPKLPVPSPGAGAPRIPELSPGSKVFAAGNFTSDCNSPQAKASEKDISQGSLLFENCNPSKRSSMSSFTSDLHIPSCNDTYKGTNQDKICNASFSHSTNSPREPRQTILPQSPFGDYTDDILPRSTDVAYKKQRPGDVNLPNFYGNEGTYNSRGPHSVPEEDKFLFSFGQTLSSTHNPRSLTKSFDSPISSSYYKYPSSESRLPLPKSQPDRDGFFNTYNSWDSYNTFYQNSNFSNDSKPLHNTVDNTQFNLPYNQNSAYASHERYNRTTQDEGSAYFHRDTLSTADQACKSNQFPADRTDFDLFNSVINDSPLTDTKPESDHFSGKKDTSPFSPFSPSPNKIRGPPTSSTPQKQDRDSSPFDKKMYFREHGYSPGGQYLMQGSSPFSPSCQVNTFSPSPSQPKPFSPTCQGKPISPSASQGKSFPPSPCQGKPFSPSPCQGKPFSPSCQINAFSPSPSQAKPFSPACQGKPFSPTTLPGKPFSPSTCQGKPFSPSTCQSKPFSPSTCQGKPSSPFKRDTKLVSRALDFNSERNENLPKNNSRPPSASISQESISFNISDDLSEGLAVPSKETLSTSPNVDTFSTQHFLPVKSSNFRSVGKSNDSNSTFNPDLDLFSDCSPNNMCGENKSHTDRSGNVESNKNSTGSSCKVGDFLTSQHSTKGLFSSEPMECDTNHNSSKLKIPEDDSFFVLRPSPPNSIPMDTGAEATKESLRKSSEIDSSNKSMFEPNTDENGADIKILNLEDAIFESDSEMHQSIDFDFESEILNLENSIATNVETPDPTVSSSENLQNSHLEATKELQDNLTVFSNSSGNQTSSIPSIIVVSTGPNYTHCTSTISATGSINSTLPSGINNCAPVVSFNNNFLSGNILVPFSNAVENSSTLSQLYIPHAPTFLISGSIPLTLPTNSQVVSNTLMSGNSITSIRQEADRMEPHFNQEGQGDILSCIMKQCDIEEEFGDEDINTIEENQKNLCDLNAMGMSVPAPITNQVNPEMKNLTCVQSTQPDMISLANIQNQVLNSDKIIASKNEPSNSDSHLSPMGGTSPTKGDSQVASTKLTASDHTTDIDEVDGSPAIFPCSPNEVLDNSPKPSQLSEKSIDEEDPFDSIVHSFYGDDTMYGLHPSANYSTLSLLSESLMNSSTQEKQRCVAESLSNHEDTNSSEKAIFSSSQTTTIKNLNNSLVECPKSWNVNDNNRQHPINNKTVSTVKAPENMAICKMSPCLPPTQDHTDWTDNVAERAVEYSDSSSDAESLDESQNDISKISVEEKIENSPEKEYKNFLQKGFGVKASEDSFSGSLSKISSTPQPRGVGKMASTPSTSRGKDNLFSLELAVSPINNNSLLTSGTTKKRRRLSFDRLSKIPPILESTCKSQNDWLANQTMDSKPNTSGSEIEGPSLDNTAGFKVNLDDTSNKAQVKHEVQLFTLMSLEVHVNTRHDLCPNPMMDSVATVFYSIYNHTTIYKQEVVGMITVSDSSLQANCPGGSASSLKNSLQTSVPAVENCVVHCVESESLLFDELIGVVRKWDPDILLGYEIQMVSWGYLIRRAINLKINLTSKLSRVRDKREVYVNKIEQDATVADQTASLDQINIPGRIILNVWRLMRKEVSLNVYTFENIYFHVLHRRTPLFSFKDLTSLYQSLGRGSVIRYYVTRVLGTIQFLEKFDLIRRTSEMACLFGIQFYEVLSRGSQFRVESMMLRSAASVLPYVPVSPTVQQRAHSRAPECVPLILEPESRFYKDPVVVLDFQSLYPSMIIAYNYCFSTCLGRVEHLGRDDVPFEFGCTSLSVHPNVLRELVSKNGIHVSPQGVAFVKQSIRRGILPRMLEEILETRIMVKKSMKKVKGQGHLRKLLDARQMALKLVSNVTYGYTAASFSGRMPNVEVADSILGKARETLERAIHLIENTSKWGAKVVYGDTDSVFLLLEGRTKEEAFKIGQEIADAVTATNPRPVKLKFEKVYLPCFLQTKKRYVGFMYETLDQKSPVFDAKGIETVRRDTCPAAAKILEKSLKTYFRTYDISLVQKYVQKQFQRLLSGRSSIKDCIFAKEYRGLTGYRPGACVPALEIARNRLNKDPRSEPRVGERVPYVVVYGFPGLPIIRLVREPTELLKDPNLRINAIYYITRVIIPPLERMFNLMNTDVKAWYANIARTTKLNLPMIHDINQPKETITQYFASKNCPSCENPTSSSVCDACSKDLQGTIVALNDKIRKWERKVEKISSICVSCTKFKSGVEKCKSIDCSVLFKLNLAKRDISQAPYVRKILDEDLF